MIFKRFIVAAALAAALVVSGCADTKSILEGGSSLVATITNPASDVDIYRVKNVYATVLTLAVNYRSYCWSRPYAELMADPVAKPICEQRRRVVTSIQRERPKVAKAISTAESFVRDNPTISAASLVQAAWKAVKDFQAIVPKVEQ